MLKKKTLSAVLVLVFLVGTMTGVMGASTITNIKASIDSAIKVKLNGSDFSPKDSKGKIIKPVIYNSKYYVPIKDFAETTKMAYSYDTKTKTIYLGEKVGPGTNIISLKAKTSNYWVDISNTVDSDMLTYQKDESSSVFKSGIRFKESYGSGTSWGKAVYSLGNKYQTIKFSAWSDGKATLKLVDADHSITLKEIALSDLELHPDIEVNVGGVNNLQIETSQEGKVNVFVADAYLN